MRRSFGGGGKMGGGSGGVLRTVHRAVRAGIGGASPDPFSSSGSVSTTNSRKTKRPHIKQSTSPKNKSLALCNSSSNNNSDGSSSFASLINLPISAASGVAAPAWRACSSPTSDDLEWEYVERSDEDERAAAPVFYEDFVFATVPSRDEAQHAVSALQQVVGSSFIQFANKGLANDSGKNFPEDSTSPIRIARSISSDDELELDWAEPSSYICDSKTLQPQGSNRVYDAFHLLQTDPSVQRMVISLSSDEAVWDAVLNNDAVREFRGSISQVDNEVKEENLEEYSVDGSNLLKDIMDWAFANTKAKIMELINKITELVNEIFQPSDDSRKDGTTDSVDEKLRTSLFLSVVVLLIVVISRVQSARS